MTRFARSVTTWLCLSSLLVIVGAHRAVADTTDVTTTARVLVGWTFGDAPQAGPSVRVQVFTRVTGDANPSFFDLGGELAWEGTGPRVGFGARHEMWLVRDVRFEQVVIVGLSLPRRASDGGVTRSLDVWASGSFGFQPVISVSGRGGVALGAHALWGFGTSLRRPVMRSVVGAGASAGYGFVGGR